MGRLLRVAAPGVLGAAVVVAVVAAYKLWADIDRDFVGKPDPVPVGRWVKRVPVYDTWTRS